MLNLEIYIYISMCVYNLESLSFGRISSYEYDLLKFLHKAAHDN